MKASLQVDLFDPDAPHAWQEGFYLKEPDSDTNGEIIRDEDGEPKMFESPVAALTFARKRVEGMM